MTSSEERLDTADRRCRAADDRGCAGARLHGARAAARRRAPSAPRLAVGVGGDSDRSGGSDSDRHPGVRSAPPGTNEQTRDGVGAEIAAPVVAPAVPPASRSAGLQACRRNGTAQIRTVRCATLPTCGRAHRRVGTAAPGRDTPRRDAIDAGGTLPESIEVEQLEVIAPIAVTPLSADESQRLRQH